MNLIIGIVLIFLIVIFYYIHKNSKLKRSKAEQNDHANSLSQAEDEKVEEFDQQDIFGAEFPFFFAINDDVKFVSMLDNINQKIINELKGLSAEYYQPLDQLVWHNSKWRFKSDLPKYLRVIPIDDFIKKGILVEPSKENKKELLESYTMKQLREIAANTDVNPANNKTETISRLSSVPLALDYKSYFKLNPKIENAYKKDFAEFAYNKLRQKFFEQEVVLAGFEGDTKKSALDMEIIQAVGDYSIGEVTPEFSALRDPNREFYRHGWWVICKGENILFAIRRTNTINEDAIMLEGGLVGYFRNKWLGHLISTAITFFKENSDSIYEEVINGGVREPNLLPEQSVLFAECMVGDSVWIFDFINYNSEIIDNPKGLDIPSLIRDR